VIGTIQWAIAEPTPVPAPGPSVNERAFYLRNLAARATLLAKAIEVSEKLCERRGQLETGSTRAAITTANAKWARAAEARDRYERNFELILDKFKA
jgi:hypothetical protein